MRPASAPARALIALLLVLAVLMPPRALFAAAISDAGDAPASGPVVAEDTTPATLTGGGQADPESRWGVIAAAACGFSIRLARVTGPNTAVIVLAVSTCLFAFVDAVESNSP